jgi:hypothetical protein
MTLAIRPALLVVSTAALALSAACGGNVVVDRASSTTAKSTSSSTATTTSTTGAGGGTTTSTTTTTTPPADLCTKLCKELVDNGCQGGPAEKCQADCADSLAKAGTCASDLVTVYQCYEPYLPQCPKDPPPACTAALNKYTQCVENGQGCQAATCSEGGGPGGPMCDCQQQCNGRALEASCNIDNGKTVCACKIDGAQVGTCATEGWNDACNLSSGCCAGFYK